MRRLVITIVRATKIEMETLLNLRIFRIIIGTAIGIPFTAVSIILGLHGLFIGYGGIREGNILMMAIGIITITDFIGIGGAWLRLVSSTKEISKEEQKRIRIMLFNGLAASFALFVWALYSDIQTSLIAFVLLICVAFFILATPKKL